MYNTAVPIPSRPAAILAATAFFALALSLPACGALDRLSANDENSDVGTTKVPPIRPVARPTTAAAPGTVIDATEIAPPYQARSWRVDHHSTTATGADVAVRALLVVPMRDTPPGGFPLVVWGHPTRGLADACAPSLEGATTIPLVNELVAEGFAVVAPDYEGLGAEGPNPYLVGPSEGHTMLDAVRAAKQVPGSGVRDASPVYLWGFSQGGHAAAFAGELAASYAPEIPVKGVALAAPVSDVAHFVRRSETWPAQMGVLVAIAAGFASAYPELSVTDVLTDAVVADLPQLEELCISEVNALFDRPIADSLRSSPRELPGWSGRLEESRAGQRAPGAPVLVIQGDQDDIIDPADTTTLVANYCRLGEQVSYVVRRDENHGILTGDDFLPWLRDRQAGIPAPSSCFGS